MMTPENIVRMREIILAAKSGDREAFGVLYQEYFTPIYRYVFFRVSSKDEAEELAQDVFVKAFHAFARYEVRSDSPLPYFYTIARNVVIDWQKKRKTVRVDEEMFHEIPDERSDTSAFATEQEQVSALRVAMRALPDEQREALELKFFSELSGKEVSALMGKSEVAVRQIQSRGLKALKEHFFNTYGRS